MSNPVVEIVARTIWELDAATRELKDKDEAYQDALAIVTALEKYGWRFVYNKAWEDAERMAKKLGGTDEQSN